MKDKKRKKKNMVDFRTNEDIAYVIECTKCDNEIPIYFGSKCKVVKCLNCYRYIRLSN